MLQSESIIAPSMDEDDDLYLPPTEHGPVDAFTLPSLTAKQVIQTGQILECFHLPPELVVAILNYAEYWVVQRFSNTLYRETVPYHGKTSSLAETFTLYLQTGPIGEIEGNRLIKPQKVVFRVENQENLPSILLDTDKILRPDPSHAKASWFDVSIFREDASWEGIQRREPIDVLINDAPAEACPFLDLQAGDEVFVTEDQGSHDSGPVRTQELPWWLYRTRDDTCKLRGGFEIVRNGAKGRWLLQRTAMGTKHRHQYTIEWNLENVQQKTWPQDGTGKGNGFVSSLRCGDRIAVWARVRHDSNNVYGVEVDVHYSVL